MLIIQEESVIKMYLFKFELIKVWRNKKTKLVILILFLYLLITFVTRLNNVSYVDSNGNSVHGFPAVESLKKEKEKWEGVLSEEKIGEIIQFNKQVNENKDNFENGGLTDKGYYQIQGLEDIRELINRSFGGFQNYNYYEIDALSPEKAAEFYTNRENALLSWLDSTAKYNYSESEKNYFIHSFENIDTPFQYTYSDGWKKIIEFSSTLFYGIALCICILVSSVFSKEYEVKADPVFYASYFGRSKGIKSKLLAAFIMATSIYFIINIIFMVITFVVFGTKGGNNSIQTNSNYWFSIYNFTNIETVIMILFLGYLVSLMLMLFTLWISSKTRNSNAAIILSFLFIFGSGLLGQISNENKWVAKIVGLMPDKLLGGNVLLSEYTLYSFGSITIIPFVILPILYLLACMVLIVLILRNEHS